MALAELQDRPAPGAAVADVHVDSPSSMLDAVRAIAQGPLRDAADGVDRGIYPRDILKALGTAGAFAAHLGPGAAAGDYASAIRAMAEVSAVCGATGFMVWCQQVCGFYLQQSGSPALMHDLLPLHATGARLGGTGMSNPMKAYAGIEPLLLKARPVPGGYRVSGTLPWVSNLGPDHYSGTLAGVEGPDGSVVREIMFLLRCDAPGVELRNCPSFSAMEGTNTWAIRCTDVFIGADEIIASAVSVAARGGEGAAEEVGERGAGEASDDGVAVVVGAPRASRLGESRMQGLLSPILIAPSATGATCMPPKKLLVPKSATVSAVASAGSQP